MYNLILIGNGFDLAHDQKTSYRHFLNQLNKNAWDNPDQFTSILRDDLIGALRRKDVRKDQRIYKNQFIQQLLDLGHLNNWSDIEYRYFRLINEVANQPNSTQRIKIVNAEFEQIKKYLKIYLSDEQRKFTKMTAFDFFFSGLNNSQTLVLNFNYTNTVSTYLEDYKNIKQINIHGELDNENNPMIFGFAASDAESKILIDMNEEGFMRNIKKLNYLFTNNDKELKSLMDETRGFDVIILGHSCGVSDRLILSEIFNHKNLKSITPIYYKDREGYLQTAINIDRIIDDYSKEKNEPKSFIKLENYPQCFPMIQHDSKEEDINKFKTYIARHKIQKANRYDPAPMTIAIY